MLDASHRRSGASVIFASDSWFTPIVMLPVVIWYATFLSDFDFNFLAPVENGLAFNSMAMHMLAGRFDVDPGAIGFEAFSRDGRTYSYFGPFVGVVRFALAPFVDLATTDLTRVFCLLAAVGASFIRLAAVRVVWNSAPPSGRRDILCLSLAVVLLLGGPEVQFLKASIYQEVIGWADLWSTAFVFVALKGLLATPGFTAKRLAALAALAGLALLTRVSTAVGLYLALGFLIISLARTIRSGGAGGRASYMWTWLARGIDAHRGRPAIVVLAIFAALVGFVNYERWGSPLMFADYHRYVLNQTMYLDRLPRLALYGEFNLRRIPYGLIYYFLPVWAVPTQGGFFLEGGMRRLIESVELPPASFLATDPLLLLLGAAFPWGLWRRRGVGAFDVSNAVAILGGLAAAPLLMLTAVSMCFRYRMEFYPLFEFAAFAGTIVLCSVPGDITRVWKSAILVLCVIGVLSAHVVLITYKRSPIGPFQDAGLRTVRAAALGADSLDDSR